MDMRHVCHLIAECLNLTGSSLLGEDAGAVLAQVAEVTEASGTIVLTVESRSYEIVIFERSRHDASGASSPPEEEGE